MGGGEDTTEQRNTVTQFKLSNGRNTKCSSRKNSIMAHMAHMITQFLTNKIKLILGWDLTS